jgi:predicted O-methyltransferase YrrM
VRGRAAKSGLTEFLADAYASGHVVDEAGVEVPLEPHSVTREQGQALTRLAVSEGAERTVEVGLALGMSSLFLCRAVLERNGRHVTIDRFQRESWRSAG